MEIGYIYWKIIGVLSIFFYEDENWNLENFHFKILL